MMEALSLLLLWTVIFTLCLIVKHLRGYLGQKSPTPHQE